MIPREKGYKDQFLNQLASNEPLSKLALSVPAVAKYF